MDRRAGQAKNLNKNGNFRPIVFAPLGGLTFGSGLVVRLERVVAASL